VLVYSLVGRLKVSKFGQVKNEFQEPLKKRVGGSLTVIPLFQRLEMLRRNAQFLRKGNWKPPIDDGTFVRKTVGNPR